MTQTIGETQNLIFGSGGSNATAFERRRWFRRPADSAMSEARIKELDDADQVLAKALESSIPSWSRTAGAESPGLDLRLHCPPRMPYDVFAFSAYLIENAGIYHRMQPRRVSPDAESGGAPSKPLDVSHEDRDLVSLAAKTWRELPTPRGDMADFARHMISAPVWDKISPLFESWWVVAAACQAKPLLEAVAGNGAQPVWWKHVWRLLAISDEAAAGTAFQLDVDEMKKFISGEKTDLLWFEFELLIEHALSSLDRKQDGPKGLLEFEGLTTLSVARPTLINVLPKVRTPSVGCTLRSLSHHLALLPPSGVVEGRWTPSYVRPLPEPGSMPSGVMNLLLVPMPYSIKAASFVPAHIEDKAGSEAGTPRIGYFDVRQNWITDIKSTKIMNFLDDLISTVQSQATQIHGIVFPELALDHDTFERVREHVSKHVPDAEILISGISGNEHDREGNFVGVATFPGRRTQPGSQHRQTIREKHHRWKLDQTQLRDYGLLGALSPELSWWENISLESRKVDFTVMRREFVLAAMICEDLARVDPCQQVIRAIGPNLVVALLMDAPQIEARWPARYATVLAEDPGCSVLTLTSRGLMTRQHRLGTFRSDGDDRVVAMWRDDGNASPRRLRCPYDAQGVLLTIAARAVTDVALDGRPDARAKAWRYVGDVPLRIPSARKRHADVLGDDDLACW